MRFSELGGKEIIDLNNGSRMSTSGQTDLVIDTATGKIHSMLLPGNTFFGFHRKKEEIMIPWDSIRTIGADIIIIDGKMSPSLSEEG
jgi:YlmC/YmxH family sporulation protein